MTHTLILLVLLFFQNPQQPNRPTEPTDPMPPPNMDYFIGAWSFEWNVPESPLGPAGKFKGKETYKKQAKGSAYESLIEGDGPAGPFKGRALTEYNEKDKIVTRTESALFGLSIKKDGKTVKLKGKTLMLSPANYRLQVQISIDGGPYKNFGNPWFTKMDAEASK